MIELKNVSFSYADSSVATLENLSVTIPTGSFVAIVGDNGAGKSTFCKLLNGIIPTFIDGELSGEIRVQRVEVREKKPAVLAKTVGYVYQDFENQLLRPKVLDDASYIKSVPLAYQAINGKRKYPMVMVVLFPRGRWGN